MAAPRTTMRWRRAIALLAALAAVASCRSERPAAGGPPSSETTAASAPSAAGTASSAPRSGRARRGGQDVTFLVTSDTHFGYGVRDPPGDAPLRSVEALEGIEPTLRREIDAMNALPTKAYPAALGGTIAEPRGVVVAGDLTDEGTPEQWSRFVQFFGERGGDGLLRWPVFESIGNHDRNGGRRYVSEQVARRHGGVRYSWDWDDLHLVMLGEGPDEADIAWLRADLDAVGPEVGLLVFLHFSLEGPYSRGFWFGDGPYREPFAAALEGRRVLGIFHGHYHSTGFYQWHGHDVYVDGSAKARWHNFTVVRVTDDRMRVASFDYEQQRFSWWHEKPVFDAVGRGDVPEVRYLTPGAGLVGSPGWMRR